MSGSSVSLVDKLKFALISRQKDQEEDDDEGATLTHTLPFHWPVISLYHMTCYLVDHMIGHMFIFFVCDLIISMYFMQLIFIEVCGILSCLTHE